MSAFKRITTENLRIAAYLLRWLALATPVGVLVGSACALFLWLLDRVTELRWQHGWLLFLLPLSGLLVAYCYRRFGHDAGGGNNLIVDQIHEPGAGGGDVPAKLAPLVFIGTILTHLCGGSAGREGTAVQMGGSLASMYSRLTERWLGTDKIAGVRTLLMTGVAAGFGGVFGTPLAGAVFALEVPAIGRMSYAAAIPCLIASAIADRTCAMWGIHHTRYPQLINAGAGPAGTGDAFDWLLLVKVILAGAVFGLASRLFSELAHAISNGFRVAIRLPILRPVVGGLVVIAMAYLLGTRDYLGLGVTSPDPHAVTLVSAFNDGGAHAWSWLWKIIFTAVTLGAAFKGGEVTPLFYIGATLGNSLSSTLNAPTPLFAALGFAAVFAGATNTPLACTIMAIELFGPGNVLFFAAACFMAYACSGHSGIYLSQRIATPKIDGVALPPESSLRTAAEYRKQRHKRTRRAIPSRLLGIQLDGACIMKTTRQHRVAGREMASCGFISPVAPKGGSQMAGKRCLGRDRFTWN